MCTKKNNNRGLEWMNKAAYGINLRNLIIPVDQATYNLTCRTPFGQ